MTLFKNMNLEELSAHIMNLEELVPQVKEALLQDGRKGAQAVLYRRLKKDALKKSEEERLENMLNEERELLAKGFKNIAGVDEAGRGPLAGPVVAAAVILPPGLKITGLDDSKKLSKAVRQELYDQIVLKARAYGLGSASKDEIDRIGIAQATFLAMKRSLKRLVVSPDFLLVDGFKLRGTSYQQKALVKGDSLSLSIAAASVLAKVSRDAVMEKLDEQYPGYGFARHMGYGTKEHRTALKKLGPCPEHRQSFQLL